VTDSPHRRAWAVHRRHMEERLWRERLRHTPTGLRKLSVMSFLNPYVVDPLCRLSGLHGRGLRNAARPRLTALEVHLPQLPERFDGYRILFLSDLHVGQVDEALTAAIGLVERLEYDLALLGGDYQLYGSPSAAETARLLAPLLAALKPADGIAGVMGNHDSHALVEPLEALGVRLLLNESLELSRDGQSIHLIGCDDVHAFYDHAAQQALTLGEGFRIALVHSPDFAPQAAAAGCAFYLAGHTHGGQICLPGGRPLLTGMDSHHHLARGLWRLHGMQGYTTTGLGGGTPAVRYNCPPEVVLITLRLHV